MSFDITATPEWTELSQCHKTAAATSLRELLLPTQTVHENLALTPPVCMLTFPRTS